MSVKSIFNNGTPNASDTSFASSMSAFIELHGIAIVSTFSFPNAFVAKAITVAQSLPPLFPITTPSAFVSSTYAFIHFVISSTSL